MKSSLPSVLMFSAVRRAVVCRDGRPDLARRNGKSHQGRRHEVATAGGGFQISILYTNPTTQATYLVIRGPGNLHVPRHWHSSNESITVVKGMFVVAHDGSDDKTVLTPGGFAYMPAKMIHEAWTGDEGALYLRETLVQGGCAITPA